MALVFQQSEIFVANKSQLDETLNAKALIPENRSACNINVGKEQELKMEQKCVF